jgi:predicted N-acetyltransferase YhbS
MVSIVQQPVSGILPGIKALSAPMTKVRIAPGTADAATRIERLLDRVFGPARTLKAAQRLRDGRLPAEGLDFIAEDGKDIVGTICFWHIGIGHGAEALLLGPMAVDPKLQGEGVGASLIARGLFEANRLGHKAVVLVGDPPYYGRFGFDGGLTRSMMLPGAVDARRLLAVELAPGALRGAAGLIRPTGPLDPAWRYTQQAA